MKKYQSLNPATEELIASYDCHPDSYIEEALEHAWRAFGVWKRESIEHRATLQHRVAKALDEKAAELARIMALEMGKPLQDGIGEAKKCAWACRYYADHAEEFLARSVKDSDAKESFVYYAPLGPVLAVMPWNFPFWQVFRFASAALMAGNVVLLKHASNNPQCALAMEQIFKDCGYPEGMFQNLFATNDQVENIIADKRVRGVTLTGSTNAGRHIAATAGKNLKPVVLELGGSDPFIVFPDADVKKATETAANARCINSGQSCIAAKRFIVHRDILDDFTAGFVDAMRAMKVGDPLEDGTDIGPMARKELRDELHEQVTKSVDAGAKPLLGGQIPDRKGFFYPPTVLTNIPEDSPAAREELFGPVASIFSFNTDDEAVEIANNSDFGLGGSVWTSSRPRMENLIPRIEVGALFFNQLVKSDPRVPFGGVKDSGFGRELSREGILEFTNQKTVWIE